MGKRKANHTISGMNADPHKDKVLVITKSLQMKT